MIKKISNETINAIKDGAVVELGANAKVEHKGKSVVLTINGKEYIYRDGDYTTEKLIEYINLHIFFTIQTLNREKAVDTIKNYLDNYSPSYLDSFGECVITVYWNEFTEELKERLTENVTFANNVRDALYDMGVIEKPNDFAVCDDGVYVTVDYDKFFNVVAA